MIEWFNYYGLIIMSLMMISNIIFAITHKINQPQVNKTIEALEQAGRYGCFALMIFNIPFICSGFYFESAELVYLVTNGILICSYLLIWMICWNRHMKFRSYALSILPTAKYMNMYNNIQKEEKYEKNIYWIFYFFTFSFLLWL